MCALPLCSSLSKQHLLQFTLLLSSAWSDSAWLGLFSQATAEFLFLCDLHLGFLISLKRCHKPGGCCRTWSETSLARESPLRKRHFPSSWDLHFSFPLCRQPLSLANVCPSVLQAVWTQGLAVFTPGVSIALDSVTVPPDSFGFPPKGLCCCFSSLSSLCVTFPRSPGPTLKTSNGNLEASVVLRELLGSAFSVSSLPL